MNSPLDSLEARVRAAVQDTAAEIGQADVPPVRAGERGGRWLHGVRNGTWLARHTALRWGIPLAAAVAVVAVVGVTSLVPHVLHPGTRPGAPSIGAKPAVKAKPTATAYPPDLRAELIGMFTPATGAQFAQGAQLNGAIRGLEGQAAAKCMAQAGYKVPVLTAAQWARTFYDLTDFPDLNAIAKAGALPNVSLPALPGTPGTKAYQAASNRCGSAADALFSRTISAGTKLGDPFTTIMLNNEHSAPVQATIPALRTCAAKYGWPHDPYGPDRPLNSWSDFVTWVSGHIDGAMSRGASAATMHHLDVQWAAVFVRCGRPTVAVMERVQLASQRTYLAAHAAQLTALVANAKADFGHAVKVARR